MGSRKRSGASDGSSPTASASTATQLSPTLRTRPGRSVPVENVGRGASTDSHGWRQPRGAARSLRVAGHREGRRRRAGVRDRRLRHHVGGRSTPESTPESRLHDGKDGESRVMRSFDVASRGRDAAQGRADDGSPGSSSTPRGRSSPSSRAPPPCDAASPASRSTRRPAPRNPRRGHPRRGRTTACARRLAAPSSASARRCGSSTAGLRRGGPLQGADWVIVALRFIRWMNDRRISGRRIDGVNLSIATPYDVDAQACGWTPICARSRPARRRRCRRGGRRRQPGVRHDRGSPSSLGTGFRFLSITDPGNARTR